MHIRLLILICLFGISSYSLAQTGAVPAKTAIEDLGFIAGKWKTSHAWGEMEENWSAPLGNTMMCSFRCVKDGKLLFYEFITIEQPEEGVPVMYLRHFGPENIAWEEKNQPYKLSLTHLDQNKAVFERSDKKQWITFEKHSVLSMTVILESIGKDGKKTTDQFDYTRDFQ